MPHALSHHTAKISLASWRLAGQFHLAPLPSLFRISTMTLSNLMAQIPVWSLILNCTASHMTVRKYFRLSALGSWERKSSLAFCSRTERETLYSLVGKLREHLAVSLAENQQVFLKGSHCKWRAMLLMAALSYVEERIAKDLRQNTILPYIRVFPALCS